MTTKIAINGFGRIGRCVLRALIENGFDGIEVVAINDLTDAENLLHLLKYDSVHGRLTADAELKDGSLHVAGQTIRMTAERDPAKLPWGDVDVAYECTGFFTTR
ncbi:MAG: glyceraldehyde 3-phosphate dehydrogenase NAD-binding domain-containing protein, partial [Sulfitobacter sp.]